jgi:hypothetical protein
MKPTTYRPLSYASRFFNSPSFVDLATFWMARRMGLTATCAVAIPQCALVAAAVYVSALCGGLMGLFLDGAFSRNLLTGVFELDSFFSPVLLFCRCASSLLIGTRTVYVTLFVRNITTARNAVLFTLWRSGREYLSACFALWYILGRDRKKGGRTVVVVVGSVWVCSLSLFKVHTQRHANEAIEEAMHFCETGQQRCARGNGPRARARRENGVSVCCCVRAVIYPRSSPSVRPSVS